jgi:phosphoribosylformimino-5-aminoimidazole carboxamide ribotide isomerase
MMRESLFNLYPAIDLRGGQVVRLHQGEDHARTTYDNDPLAVAQGYVAQGARILHLVDLDAAFGHASQATAIRQLIASIDIPVQVGGGLRDDDAVARALDAGAAKVVIGSAAVERPEWVSALVAKYGDKIVVGIDAKHGEVRTRGWLKGSGIDALVLAADMAKRGVQTAVVTNIARDGTGSGPDVDFAVQVAKASGLKVVVSGGVGDLGHVAHSARRRSEGLIGLIIGKALLDNAFTLSAAQEVLDA